MKIKLLLTALFIAGCQNFYAQENTVKPATDSVKTTSVLNANQLEKQRGEIAVSTEQLEKERKKLEKEKKKFEKEQNRIIAAEKSVGKAQRKLEKEKENLTAMQDKLSKKRDKLTPLEIEEKNVAIAKQQLRLKEIEGDIEDAQKKLNKVRD